jgi:hypothetical protein
VQVGRAIEFQFSVSEEVTLSAYVHIKDRDEWGDSRMLPLGITSPVKNVHLLRCYDKLYDLLCADVINY